jgi:hypothetical protein
MNGFVRSVQDQEGKEDLNSTWGLGASPTGSPHNSCQ